MKRYAFDFSRDTVFSGTANDHALVGNGLVSDADDRTSHRKTAPYHYLHVMWAETSVCGPAADNLGRVAANVVSGATLFANNVVSKGAVIAGRV